MVAIVSRLPGQSLAPPHTHQGRGKDRWLQTGASLVGVLKADLDNTVVHTCKLFTNPTKHDGPASLCTHCGGQAH